MSQEDIFLPCCFYQIPTTYEVGVVTTLPQLEKLRPDRYSTDVMLHMRPPRCPLEQNTRWGWVTPSPQDTSVSAHLADYLYHLVNWQLPSSRPRSVLKAKPYSELQHSYMGKDRVSMSV